jgi:hypothetical protein
MNTGIELSISCDECVRRATPDCQDCLVSYVLGEEPGHLEMTARDADVIELFTTEGLLPVLKYRPHVRALGE